MQVRSCVGCRNRDQRSKLLRIAVRDGALVVDDRAVMPGRGAWVHPNAQCMNVAVTRRAFSRTLRVSKNIDITPLENRLKKIMDHS
ncbi:MAG: YlxR family protein [Canibacter sp.]